MSLSTRVMDLLRGCGAVVFGHSVAGHVYQPRGYDMNPDLWNQGHHIGSPVVYWSGIRTDDGGVESKTRSEAWTTPSGDLVVMVDGLSGYVAVSHVRCAKNCPVCVEARHHLPRRRRR